MTIWKNTRNGLMNLDPHKTPLNRLEHVRLRNHEFFTNFLLHISNSCYFNINTYFCTYYFYQSSIYSCLQVQNGSEIQTLNDSDEGPLLSRQEMIQAQDRGLDDLASIIRRQRDIGIIIGNEVDEQNGITSLFSSDLLI